MADSSTRGEGKGAALVTGAGHRIGRAIALRLASEGYDVAVHYNSSEAQANRLVEEIRALGVIAGAVHADLSIEGQVRGLINRGRDAVGSLTLLVNSAALFEEDRFGHLSCATWDAHMAINLKAPVLLADDFSAQAGQGASVVNIIDQRVMRPTADFPSYSISKAALWAATQMMAIALAPKVRVNGVAPGPTLQSIHQSEDEFAAEASTILTRAPVCSDEIASAVSFLAASKSITGHLLMVDGGQHLASQ